MPEFPRPPNNQDLFWFFFTALFAMIGEAIRAIHSEEQRGFLMWVAELLSVGFWGGLAGWLLAYYSSMDTPMLAAISAVAGHYGHKGVLRLLRKLIDNITKF